MAASAACLQPLQGAKPYHILTITFTNKAAQELKSRLQAAIQKAFEAAAAAAGRPQQVPVVKQQVRACTFHSFCYSLVRTFHKVGATAGQRDQQATCCTPNAWQLLQQQTMACGTILHLLQAVPCVHT